MSITVNGENLDKALINQELALLRQRYGEQLSPVEMQEREGQIAGDARENAVERLMLIQEARKTVPHPAQGDIDRQYAELIKQYGSKEQAAEMPEDEVKKLKASVADSIRLERYFNIICKDVPEPTDDECLNYYNENKNAFSTPEMIRASHVVRRPSRDEDFGLFNAQMLNLREQAVKTGDFAQLARQYSDCNDDGGDLGWFPRGTMVESFENAVFALQPGEVSDVFRTEFGYHIAKVHEKRPAGTIPFEKVKKDIRNRLLEQRKNDEIGKLVDKLRETAQIVETPDPAL
jgi:parvulin-like peptidyl-prolyl isomerase